MGYGIHLRDADFKIKASKSDQALKALQEYFKDKKNTYVDVRGVMKSKRFHEAMLECRFLVEVSHQDVPALPTKEDILVDVQSAIEMLEARSAIGSNKRMAKAYLDQAVEKLTAKPGDYILIHGISFEGENQDGTEHEMFNAIAPFVEPGSYIEMQGEDGAIWRWVFQDDTCIEKAAEIGF